MRIWLSGAGGFVGSNLAEVFAASGAELAAPRRAEVDVTDAGAVDRSIGEFGADAVVHCAILNELTGLSEHRRAAWDGYVGATRNVVDAANRAGAQVVLISTDWVFDGTQAPAAEDEPPNPVNTYGFLKAACELVVEERADRGAVARIAGVQGVHRARPNTLRVQDEGFGYLVASLVDALRAGEPFTVWESEDINTVATPTLATEVGDADPADARARAHRHPPLRRRRAREPRRARARGRRRVRPRRRPPALRAAARPVGGAGAYDTRLDATATAAALDVELPSLRAQLEQLRREFDAAR